MSEEGGAGAEGRSKKRTESHRDKRQESAAVLPVYPGLV